MPDDDEAAPLDPAYFDTPGTAPRRPRRGRRRMGQVVDTLGAQAVARLKPTQPAKIVERREHADKAKRLLAGGVSKGETAGFGITSGRTEPPDAAAPPLPADVDAEPLDDYDEGD